jgi:hypothetical protein
MIRQIMRLLHRDVTGHYQMQVDEDLWTGTSGFQIMESRIIAGVFTDDLLIRFSSRIGRLRSMRSAIERRVRS